MDLKGQTKCLIFNRALYGKNMIVPLRELIQNASDAIRARRIIEDEPSEYGDIVTILEPSDEEVKLAALYQEQGILPARSTTDALHIATAAVNDLDMILSLNFEHIVRK